jgi:hypothetical protein
MGNGMASCCLFFFFVFFFHSSLMLAGSLAEKRLTANSFWQFETLMLFLLLAAAAAAVVHSWLQFLYTAEEEEKENHAQLLVATTIRDEREYRVESGPERDQWSRAIIDQQRFRKEDLWGEKKQKELTRKSGTMFTSIHPSRFTRSINSIHAAAAAISRGGCNLWPLLHGCRILIAADLGIW